MPTNEEIAAIKATFNTLRNAQVRQVTYGYVVTTNTTYIDPATNAATMSENAEGVASTTDEAVRMMANYIRGGSFEAQSVVDELQAALDLVPPKVDRNITNHIVPRMPPLPADEEPYKVSDLYKATDK